MSSVKLVALGLGACGVAGFVGYCIYFDRKRRSDPDFKKKLRERRQRTHQAKSRDETDSEMPDLSNPAAVQEYFVNQVAKGEKALESGDAEKAVEHLLQAIRVSGNPGQMIQMFQNALPQPVFKLLVQRLPEVLPELGGGAGRRPVDEDVD
eukprot:m.308895 g.308895  ORF g.308895 m.308895 type:complete len:151 (+) comp45003_c0_seq1:127-579(+)